MGAGSDRSTDPVRCGRVREAFCREDTLWTASGRAQETGMAGWAQGSLARQHVIISVIITSPAEAQRG